MSDGLSKGSSVWGGSASPEEDTVSWEDYAKGFKAGVGNTVGNIAAGVDYITPEFDQGIKRVAGRVRDAANDYASEQMASASPAFQRAANAGILDGGVLEEGLGRSFMAKAIMSTPDMILAIVPGAMVGRAMTGASAAARGMAGAVTGQAAGAGLNAASVVNAIYSDIDRSADEALIRESSFYAGLRSMGASELEAKKALRDEVVGVAPLISAAVSFMIPGAEGAVAGRMAGRAATAGIIKSGLKTGAKEGTQEFIEEGTNEALQQDARTQYSPEDMDWLRVVEMGAQGLFQGVPVGGALGAASGIGGGKKPALPVADTAKTAETTEAATQQVTPPNTGLDTGDVDPALKLAIETKTKQAPGKKPDATAGAPTPPRKQANERQLQRARERAAAKGKPVMDTGVQPPSAPPTAPEVSAVPETAPAAPAAPATPAVETPEQEAVRLATELSPGIDPAAALALEEKAAPPPAPPEQRAAQLATELSQPAVSPVAADPASPVPPVSSEQVGPVVEGAAPAVPPISPAERTPPQGQVSQAPTVDPPAATTPYDRALALIDGGTPLTSVNSVQNKVGVAYKTAVKLYNRLKQEGRISDPVPRPVKAPQTAPAAAPVPTQPVAVEAAPAPAMGQETAIQEAPTAPKGEALKKSNRTKPSDLTQQVTPPAAEVRKVEVTPEQEAAYVAASEAKTRRVLQPATPEAIAAAEATSNAMLDRIAANKAKAEEDAKKAKKQQKKIQDAAQGLKVGGDKNKKRVVKKEAKGDAVMSIIQQGTPSKGTVVKNRGDMLGVQIRLEGLLEEARKQGHKPQPRNYDSTPTGIVYLAHAEMMLDKLRKTLGSDKASAEEIDSLIEETNDFLAEEFDVRSGGGELMRRKRREIGDLTSDPKKAVADAEVKANPEDNPAPPENYERPTLDEDTSDGPDVAEVIEEDDSNEDVTRQEVPVRERPVPKAQEDDVRGYAGVKEGTVKKEVVVGGRKKLNLAPPVEAKKITLAPKGAALLRKVQAATTQQVTDEVTTAVDGTPLFGPALKSTDRVGLDQNTFTTDVASLLGWVRERFAKNNPAFSNAMHSVISKRVADLVGDVEIRVVGREQMRRIGKVYGMKEVPGGVYFPNTDTIFIDQETVTNPDLQYVVLHEAVHAATHAAIENDAEIRSEIRTLMSFVKNTPYGKEYGMTDEHEFIAEAFSNPDFQQALAMIDIPPDIARGYGLYVGRPIRSAWEFMVAIVRKALGIPKGTYTVLDATMRVGDYILTQTPTARAQADALSINALPSFIGNRVKQVTQWVSGQPTLTQDELTSDSGPRLLALRTFDNIARAADQYFGGADTNPVRKVQETVEKMRVMGQDIFEKSNPVVENLLTMERKYQGPTWDKFANLTHDATMLNVHPDKPLDDPANKHLSKRRDAQAISEWKRLNAEWNSLPDELKDAWRNTTAYYRDMQNAMAFSILKNRVLKALKSTMSDAERDALARRYFNDLDTEEDAKTLGKELHSALKGIEELRSIKGPYFPQMRRGDWAVVGRVAFEKPKGAAKLDENTYVFKDEDEAVAYANRLWRDSGIKATVKRGFVDPKTNLPYFTDDDGTQVKATSKEPDAERRYLVGIQDEFLEYHPSQAEAEDRAREIGKTMAKVAVEERRVQPNARGEVYSEQLRSVMKRIEQGNAYKSLSLEARRETVTALNELSFQLFGGTRIQSRRIPRRYVAGASKDITRNAMEYAHSVSGYIGKLQYQPEQDQAVKEMRDYIEKNRYSNRELGVARSRIANEVDRRLNMPPEAFVSKLDQNVQRLLTLSFLDKLASLSYSIINSTQTVTNTMPLLAARFNWAKATRAMTLAYSTLGGARNIGTGFGNVGRAAKGVKQVNLMEPVRARLAKADPEYAQLFDYLRERGVVSSDAGMEVLKAARMDKGVAGQIDKGLSYADAIARALPDAVEVNNRVASALASYMLDRAAGKSPEAARRRAYDMVNGTQFNYAQTNAPAFMQHPMARIAFQFKKYAQGQYQLLGEQVAKVISNAEPGDRREGVKALVNFAATTMVFAGALGLPTEPIKYMLMAASIVGVGYSYDDLERDVRRTAAEMLGQKPGEILTRGVSRAFGFDLSSRMGLDSLTSFGMPRENTMDDWGAWLWKTTSGAPISLATDIVRGANLVATGEFQKGIELLIPFKTVADGVQTYRLATEGKTSSVTGRTTLDPLNAYEAGMRTLGFRPSREVETLERDSAYYKVRDERMGNRQRLVSQWLNAKGDDRAAIWKQIVKYNGGVDEAARITMKQLTDAQKRRNTEERRGTIVDGKRVTKDDRGIYDTGNIYGVR